MCLETVYEAAYLKIKEKVNIFVILNDVRRKGADIIQARALSIKL